MIKKFEQFRKRSDIFETEFYLFGSENSQDYDVLVSVDFIPKDIDKAHNLCKYYNYKLNETLLTDKELNCNLAIFKNGEIVEVFKGTVDELNNVLYYTYSNHKQYFPNPIKNPVERDIDEKILRVSRFIITFYSRTSLRPEIKNALRGNIIDKLNVLKKIDFVKMNEFPGKKEKLEDIYKVLAFQFGQTFSLIDGFEPDSYTKNGIIKNYPDLGNFLNRVNITNYDLKILNIYLDRFISLIESKLGKIKLFEN